MALHPVHNLALVQYEPASIGETEVRRVEFDGRALQAGQKAYQFGRTNQGEWGSDAVTVSDVRPVTLPLPMVELVLLMFLQHEVILD